jgi:hypothetical protein
MLARSKVTRISTLTSQSMVVRTEMFVRRVVIYSENYIDK